MLNKNDLSRKPPVIEPSLICLDMCNLERETKRLEEIGLKTLHIDLIDGTFSPSMPLGLDMVRQLRAKTNLDFDAHLMAMDNRLFTDELLDIGVQSMCCHLETIRHADKWIHHVQKNGVKAGVALKPGTSLHTLEFLLECVDFVLLMLINPGYAGGNGERQVAYANRKIVALREMIERQGLSTEICVDGRVSWDDIDAYSMGIVDTFVAGSTCMGNRFEQNIMKFMQ